MIKATYELHEIYQEKGHDAIKIDKHLENSEG